MPSPSPAADEIRTPSGGSYSAQERSSAGSDTSRESDDVSGSEEEAGREQCWVVLGDIHGETRRIADIPELENADGVIVSGDLTKTGGVSQAQVVLEAIYAHTPVVMAQIGNMDRAEVNAWLEEAGINLHRKVRELSPDIAVMGVGGSTFTPFGTPSEFPEARFAEWLEGLAKLASGYKYTVLISHNPPFDTVCDQLAAGGHAGSQALREFIEEHQPDVCLCGHIHEAYGQQLLGRTMVMNPGPFAAGGYIVMRLGDKIRVNLQKLDY